jgi:hypothetical protein
LLVEDDGPAVSEEKRGSGQQGQHEAHHITIPRICMGWKRIQTEAA